MLDDASSLSLLGAAAGVGFVHTLLGVDHYLPLVALARARGWSIRRGVLVATICGAGHVLSSVLLGGLGLAFGSMIASIERVERWRGGLAAWVLVVFGAAYALWGLRRAVRTSAELEPHRHGGRLHIHRAGNRPHDHAAEARSRRHDVTFFALFAVFVLGPCEPLIPLFVLPASRGQLDLALLAASIFAVVTIGTMVGCTGLGLASGRRLAWEGHARWGDALAGAIVAASGAIVLLLGV